MVDQDKRQRPYGYITRAIELLKERMSAGEVYDIDVLEIGCMRAPLTHDIDDTTFPCCNDGHSTYLFARAGLDVETVDINPVHMDNARESCKEFNTVEYFCRDAFDYAREEMAFPIDIGLLFLDAWDLEHPDGAAEKHLEFFQTIEGRLNDDCMILIDDTDLTYDMEKKEYFDDPECLSGKGRLLVPYLLERGYKIVFKERQTMLRK